MTKYIAFGEWHNKDTQAIFASDQDIQAERKKYPNRYPKKFLENHILLGSLPTLTKDACVLAFYETDDPKQLANLAAKWGPTGLLKFTFVPLVEATTLNESLKEVKK